MELQFFHVKCLVTFITDILSWILKSKYLGNNSNLLWRIYYGVPYKVGQGGSVNCTKLFGRLCFFFFYSKNTVYAMTVWGQSMNWIFISFLLIIHHKTFKKCTKWICFCVLHSPNNTKIQSFLAFFVCVCPSIGMKMAPPYPEWTTCSYFSSLVSFNLAATGGSPTIFKWVGGKVSIWIQKPYKKHVASQTVRNSTQKHCCSSALISTFIATMHFSNPTP